MNPLQADEGRIAMVEPIKQFQKKKTAKKCRYFHPLKIQQTNPAFAPFLIEVAE
jgi:hypothetical protein